MRGLIRQLLPAVLAVVVLTVLCGLIYPLVVTGISQVAFHDKANGSLVKVDGVVVGSSLIGQQFTDPKYFHPRPSAAGSGYDGLASSFSNLGPTNPDFLKSIEERVAAYREENGLAADATVPVDAVTASGVGPRPGHLGRQRQAAGQARRRGARADRGAGARHDRRAHRGPAVGVPR